MYFKYFFFLFIVTIVGYIFRVVCIAQPSISCNYFKFPSLDSNILKNVKCNGFSHILYRLTMQHFIKSTENKNIIYLYS